jgi:hypothetical protein
VTPFTDHFLYLSVPYQVARHVYARLNEYGGFSTTSSISQEEAETAAVAEEVASGTGSIEKSWKKWRKDQWELWRYSPQNSANRTLGYITQDVSIGKPTTHRY